LTATRVARGSALLAASIVLVALNLRTPVASVPPVLDDIERELGLSAVAAGVLTALPVLVFGVLAPPAPALARRYGGEAVVLAALFPVVAGVLLRAVPHSAALFAGTIVASVGVALENVIVPSVIAARFAHRMGALTGLYAGALAVGAAVAGGLTVPVADAFSGSWEAALAVWALPACVAAACTAAALRHARRSPSPGAAEARLRPLVRDRLAWQVTLFMGLQSLVFFALLSWLPTILRDAGWSAVAAGGLLSLFSVAGIPTAIAVPTAAARVTDQRALAAGVSGVLAAGVSGLIVAPGAAVLWVLLLAAGQGGALGLALALILLRAGDPARAAGLSGMAQAIGYTIAAAGPFALGAAHDASGGWDVPLALLLGVLALVLAAGLCAGRPGSVLAGQDGAKPT